MRSNVKLPLMKADLPPNIQAKGSVVIVLLNSPGGDYEEIRLSLVESGLVVEADTTEQASLGRANDSLAQRVRQALRPHVAPADGEAAILVVQEDRAPAPTRFEFPLLTIMADRREVTVEGRSIYLTKGEFDLLHLMAAQPGYVFTRDELAVGSRGKDYPVTPRAIDVQITELRRKLGVARAYIQTVRGVGYRFDTRVHPST